MCLLVNGRTVILGAISDEIGQTPEIVASTISSWDPPPDVLGFRSAYGKKTHELTAELVGQFRAGLPKGVSICCLEGNLGKADLHRLGVIEEQADYLRDRLLPWAELLGTERIRLFGGNRYLDLPRMWPTVVRFVQQMFNVLNETPAGYEMGLSVETEFATNVASLTYSEWPLLGSLQDHDYHRWGTILDPGNYVYNVEQVVAWGHGEEPTPTVRKRFSNRLEQEIAYCNQNIAEVHVKDAILDPPIRPRSVPLGEGLVPWPEILCKLAEVDFNGPYVLECHLDPEGGELDEASRYQPGGDRYGNPAHATAAYETLCELIREAYA